MKPRLVAKSFLSALWMKEVRTKHGLNSCSATNGSIITLAYLELSSRHRGLHAMTIFNAIETLWVKTLIEIDFMDKYIINIYSTEIRLEPLCSRPGAMLSITASDR